MVIEQVRLLCYMSFFCGLEGAQRSTALHSYHFYLMDQQKTLH